MIAFIPHDGVLYIWFRLGILGEFLLWAVIGFAIVAACELIKNRDRMTAAFGSIGVCAVISYVLQGYNDLDASTGFASLCSWDFSSGRLRCTPRRASGVPPAPREHGSIRSLSPAPVELPHMHHGPTLCDQW